jgi:hypothetical protein
MSPRDDSLLPAPKRESSCPVHLVGPVGSETLKLVLVETETPQPLDLAFTVNLRGSMNRSGKERRDGESTGEGVTR